MENQEPHETDWKAESRKWESRAKENLAAAKANEEAARRLARIEESQKTEAQKQQEALAAAEKRAADAELRVLRAEVAESMSDISKGIAIPASLLTGSTREELEASAQALIEFRGEQPKPGLLIPREGSEPLASGGSLGEQFAGFFNRQTGGQ